MSTGRIDDLVSQQALDQLDELYKRLGITRSEMVSANRAGTALRWAATKRI